MPEYKIINAVSSVSVPLWGNKKQYIAIHYLGVVGQSHELASDGTGAHYYIYWMERFIRDVRTMRLFGPLEQRDTTRRSIPMREMQTQSASNCAANVTVTARARMIRSGVLLRQRRKRVYGW